MVFGLFAGALGAHAARRQNEDRAFPYLAGQYYAAHLASALCASVLALLDRRARHASLALLLAPSRYVNWALQTREAVAAGPHPFPLFALAAACEALRIAYGHAYALHGKRWRFPNAVPLATACLETVAVPCAPPSRPACSSRAGSGRRNWCRAPASRSRRSCATGGTTRPSEWIGARGPSWGASTRRTTTARRWTSTSRAPRGAGGGARPRFRIADGLERVKIQGAMREVCRVDGTSIFGVEQCVAKAYTRETREWLWSNQGVGDGVYFRDVHAHHVAGKYAADFNAKAPGVRVEVVPAVVVEVLEVKGDQDAEFTLGSDRRYLHVEPYIENSQEEFSRFNSNTFDASLLLSDRHADPIAEAYSHFTWAASSGKLVVSDVQGVRSGSTLMVTDPQIHTVDRSDAFGAGNGQIEENIRAFFASHECRGICAALGLPTPSPAT